MDINARLKNAREEKGLSLSDLSKITGIAKSTLQRYETGSTKKIPMDSIGIIEQRLGLPLGYLMGWNDENQQQEVIKMFSKRLKKIRESAGYSMDKLVELYNSKYGAKMNKSTLSRYENGLQDPIYTVVVNLADFFNTSVDYLTGIKEEKSINDDGQKENTVIFHRNGQTTELKLTDEKMDMFVKMIEAFKDNDVDL